MWIDEPGAKNPDERLAHGPRRRKSVAGKIWIDAPVARVWELVSDIEMMPRFFETVEASRWEGGHAQLGLGSQFYLIHREIPRGSQWVELARVVEFDPPLLISWETRVEGVMTGMNRFTLIAENGGTLLEQTFEMIR